MNKEATARSALKLALEAMENMVKIRDCQREKGYPQSDADKRMQAAITALREALAKPDFWEGYVPEPVKPKEDVTLIDEGKTAQQEFVSPGGGYVPAIPAQQALDKKAENARELGLDYEPVCNKDPQGCWNVRCQLGKKCKNTPAQQEPVPDAFEQLMREADKPTQVLQDGVAEYIDALIKGTHEITSVTVRPKRTWQGLTQDEITELAEHYYEDKVVQVEEVIEMAEAKLRSKNDL